VFLEESVLVGAQVVKKSHKLCWYQSILWCL